MVCKTASIVHPSILKKHFQKIHGSNESWNQNLECEICNKIFTVKEKLMLHIKSTHFKEEKEQISQQNASTINSVQKNQKQFFNVNKFPCNSCDQTKHEINRQKMDKSVSKPSIKSVGLLKCPNCHQMILSERLLAKHLGNCKPKNKNL